MSSANHLEEEMSRRTQAKKGVKAFDAERYSTLGLLPGESPEEFEELRKSLIVELLPDGSVEMEIVSKIARLIWRKQNLSTFDRARGAMAERSRIIAEEINRRGIKRSSFAVSVGFPGAGSLRKD